MLSKIKKMFSSRQESEMPTVVVRESIFNPEVFRFLNEKIPKVKVDDLKDVLKFGEDLNFPKEYFDIPLTGFKMEMQDAFILKYIYRNFHPSRHLEFGTWKGEGVILCLNHCDATVWTINLWEGEPGNNHGWAYGEKFDSPDLLADQRNTMTFEGDKRSSVVYHRTDSFGLIGRFYLEAGLGKRVCQIYSDSKEWDTSNYPRDFFDSCLIDGGHAKDIVINDTFKALEVTKSGGLVMWHDFCPDEDVLRNCSAPRGVCEAIVEMYPDLQKNFSKLFWVYPSWVLMGVKK